MRNMASSLIIYESIETTQRKGKEVAKTVEGLIHVGKKETIESKRKLKASLTEANAIKKLQKELVPRFKERNSGYTRIMKVGIRKGDGSQKVRVELVS